MRIENSEFLRGFVGLGFAKPMMDFSFVGKAVEFGHKVLIAQTGEKFISHYRVMPEREEDKDLVDETLEAHRSLFGYRNYLASVSIDPRIERLAVVADGSPAT